MKLITLCTKIHFPVIYHKHPFSELRLHEKFFDEKRTSFIIREFANYKLKSFLDSVTRLSVKFPGQFKLAMSIRGLSLQLLQTHAPLMVDEINLLSKKGIIEFVAEPWSNSILSHYIKRVLKHQTEMHRNAISGIFSQSPRVFLADLPLNPLAFSEYESFSGCKSFLTISNHNHMVVKNEINTVPENAHFLIHQALSNRLQQVSSDSYKGTGLGAIAPFIRFLRKHASMVKPLVLCFNPLAKDISDFSKWEDSIGNLITKTGSSFYSLSDLEDVSNYFSIENNYSREMLLQFEQPDYWLKNNMQKEAFKQFRNIYRTIHISKQPFNQDAWDYLQDLDNFYYMSDDFFSEEFSRRNFTPFLSPHEAFTSYMNAVSNFWTFSPQKSKAFVKNNYLISPASN